MDTRSAPRGSHLPHDAHNEAVWQALQGCNTSLMLHVYKKSITCLCGDCVAPNALLSGCTMFRSTVVTERGSGESVEFAERSRSINLDVGCIRASYVAADVVGRVDSK